MEEHIGKDIVDMRRPDGAFPLFINNPRTRFPTIPGLLTNTGQQMSRRLRQRVVKARKKRMVKGTAEKRVRVKWNRILS